MSFLSSIGDNLSGAADWLAKKAEDTVDSALYAYAKSDLSDAVDKALGSAPVQNFVETTAPVREAWEWTADQLAKGPPGSPSRESPERVAEWEANARSFLDSPTDYVTDLAKKKAADPSSPTGRLIRVVEFVTRPWVLAIIGGTAVLLIAAPYVTPFLPRGK